MNDWKLRLRQSRERKELNKTELAKRLGVSNATVTDWEKSIDVGGIKELSASSLVKIHEVLGVDLYWLLSGKGTAPQVDRPAPDQPAADVVLAKPRASMAAVKTIEQSVPNMLQWVSAKEAELLTEFRALEVSNQGALLDVARSLLGADQAGARADQR